MISLVVLLASALPLGAQSEQLTLDPPLRQAFPLELREGGVRVQYPVLLNEHTILSPQAVLRFIYIDPTAATGNHGGGDDGGGRFRADKGQHGTITPDNSTGGSTHGEGSAGAWGSNDGDEDAGIFDDAKKADNKRSKKELQTEVWIQPDLFADALDHAVDTGTILVYSVPPQNRPLSASLDFPEGMLLAEVGSHVRVLALSDTSPAYLGGMRPGDEIRSFNHVTPVANLSDFTRVYAEARRQARMSGAPSYSMEIVRPGEAQPVSVHIDAPPSIPSFF